MLLRRVVAAFVLASALASLAPAGAAQQASARLTLEGPRGEVTSTRDSETVALNATLEVSGTFCQQPTTHVFSISGEARMAAGDTNTTGNKSAIVAPTPAQLTFSVPQGPHGVAAVPPYRNSQSFALTIQPQAVTNLTRFDVAVTASRTGGMGACTPSPTVVPISPITFVAAFNSTEVLPSPSPELPLPWAWAPVALVAAVLLFRRIDRRP